jgi:hypothetical protein
MSTNPTAEITRRSIEFERYVLTIFRAEATSQNKVLLTGNEIDTRLRFVDAIAPQGLFNLQGPVFLKVRYSPRSISIGQIKDWARYAYKYYPEGANFILVFHEGSASQNRFLRELRQILPTAELLILNRDRVEDLARKHPDAALAFNSSFLQGAIRAFKERDQTKNQEQHLLTLQTSYNDDRLALFLGAGISKSANFPDWSELVKRISLILFDKSTSSPLNDGEKEQIYRYFQTESPSSPIIVARLLQSSLKETFPDIVRTALYMETTAVDTSPLVQEIGSLCLPRRDRIGITSVVNYNFDDLLEAELDRRGISYRVVLSDNDEPSKSELPIYHVHGFLPRIGFLTNMHRQALVFSEDAYHQQFHDPYLWTNITQLNILRNNVCLFIGVSLTDPNQRRLLEITMSKKPGGHHYAIMRDHWIGKEFGNLTEDGQSLAKVFKGLEESAFANLGVSVLWVKSYDDVITLLSEIKA